MNAGKYFLDDQDRYNFLERLGGVVERTGTICYAWALIPHPRLAADRYGPNRYCDAPTFNWPCRQLQPSSQTPWAPVSESLQIDPLCQEDPCLLELVRYIHLNPLRAGLVSDMDTLGKYPFCGHGVIRGKRPAMARRLGISMAAVSKAIKRGDEIANKNGYNIQIS